MKKIIPILLLLAASVFQLSAQQIEVEATQQMMIVKKTATWCPPCGSWAWEAFANMQEDHSDEAVFIAAHHSDRNDIFYNEMVGEFVENLEYYFYQPAFYVGDALVSTSSNDGVEDIVAERLEAAQTAMPVAQTGMKATFDADSEQITLETRTEFFQESRGDFYLGVYFVAKEIIAYQSRQGDSAKHKMVLREALGNQTFGNLTASGVIAVGDDFETTYEFGVPENIDLENLRIVTVLWQKVEENDEERYAFVNIQKTDEIPEAIASSTFNLEEVAGFLVRPTVTEAQAVVELQLDKAFKNVQVDLIGVDGKQLTSIFSGKLQNGTHQFKVERPRGSSNGFYFVRLRLNGQSFSKHLIWK